MTKLDDIFLSDLQTHYVSTGIKEQNIFNRPLRCIFLKPTPVHTKSSVRFLEIPHRASTLTTMRIKPAFYGYYITLYYITL